MKTVNPFWGVESSHLTLNYISWSHACTFFIRVYLIGMKDVECTECYCLLCPRAMLTRNF